MEQARQIVTLAPTDPEARLQLAQVLILFNQSEQGLEEFRYLIRLAPDLTEERLRVFLRDTDVERYVKGLRLAGWSG